MGKKHGGIKGIIEAGRAPMAQTDETFVQRRRAARDSQSSGYYHRGIGEVVYGRADLERKMKKHRVVPARDSEGGYTC